MNWNTGLAQLITDFYKNLFTAGQVNVDDVLRCVPESISSIQNAELLKEVTDIEVREAIFQMHPDKAPGPDGMTPAFFQKHWNLVGKDVLKLTREFFRTGELMEGLNETNIVLIPKKKESNNCGGFTPYCTV